MKVSKLQALLSLIPLGLGGYELAQDSETQSDHTVRAMLQDIRPELSRSREQVEAVLIELQRKPELDSQERALQEELEIILEQMKEMDSPDIKGFLRPI